MNLIFIVADTFRADNLSCYGNSPVETPNLDRLAEEGVVFENCFAEGLPTIPVRRALFTGKRTFPWVDWKRSRDNILGQVVPGWQPLGEADVSLPEVLRAKGYKTGFITDTYHFFAPSMNFHRAFDSWLWIRGQEGDRYRIPSNGSLGSHDRYKANVAHRHYESNYFAPRVYQKAIEWLEDNYHHESIFLYVDTFDPHEPWDPPSHYLRMYEKEQEPNAEDVYYGSDSNKDVNEPQERHRRALYWGEVTMVDRWIGLFLDTIRDLGLLDDTMIVFMSDHGTSLGEHGVWGKSMDSVYDPLIKLPLIMRFPRKEYAGRSVGGFVQNHDIMPTLLELLGVKKWPYLEEQIKGLNLNALITKESEKVRDYIICGYGMYTCVRSHDWHYIISDEWEGPPVKLRLGHKLCRGEWLFNIKEDPECNEDVSDDHPDMVKNMKERLRELLEQYDVPDVPMKTYRMYPKREVTMEFFTRPQMPGTNPPA